MAENKSKLVEKIVKASIVGGLSLLSVVSNGQKVKEDINWTKVKEPYGKYTLTIRSTNSLPELSKYQNVNREPYLPYGNLNLPYKYNYKIPQDSIKGDVSKYLKKIDVCPDCTKTKESVPIKKKTSVKPVTTKKTPTPTKTITPQKTTEKPIVPPTNKNLEDKVNYSEKPKEGLGTSYNVNEINITNNTTNNYYLTDTTRNVSTPNKLDTLAKSKEFSLEFRTLIEGSKKVNPLNSPFLGASINPQLGKDPIWFGPYATFGFGKESDSFSEDVNKTTLLNQALQLFTETEGTRTGSSKLYYPIEFGGILSLNTKDDRVRLDLGYGLVKEVNSTRGIAESGYDWISQNGQVVGEKKPYSFEIEQGKTYNNWIPTQKVGLAVQPFKKAGFYVAAEAQHRGKPNFKNTNIDFNVKAGWNFKGRKK